MEGGVVQDGQPSPWRETSLPRLGAQVEECSLPLAVQDRFECPCEVQPSIARAREGAAAKLPANRLPWKKRSWLGHGLIEIPLPLPVQSRSWLLPGTQGISLVAT